MAGIQCYFCMSLVQVFFISTFLVIYRKGGMLLNTILTFVGGLIMWSTYFAGTHYVLWLGRFIIGVNAGMNCRYFSYYCLHVTIHMVFVSGLNSGLAPMYLTEISPVNYRGLLGSVNQLMVTISILFSNILGMDTLLGTKTLWPYLLGEEQTKKIPCETAIETKICFFSFHNCSCSLSVDYVAVLSRKSQIFVDYEKSTRSSPKW